MSSSTLHLCSFTLEQWGAVGPETSLHLSTCIRFASSIWLNSCIIVIQHSNQTVVFCCNFPLILFALLPVTLLIYFPLFSFFLRSLPAPYLFLSLDFLSEKMDYRLHTPSSSTTLTWAIQRTTIIATSISHWMFLISMKLSNIFWNIQKSPLWSYHLLF